MKAQILICLIILSSCFFNCLAQSSIGKGNLKGNSQIYQKKETSQSSKRIAIANAKNKLSEKKMNIPPTSLSRIQFNSDKELSDILTSIIPKDKLKVLSSTEKSLTLIAFVDSKGKILELEFLLNKSTILTAKEIEAIENKIKTNTTFILDPKETVGGNFFKLVKRVDLNQIYNTVYQ